MDLPFSSKPIRALFYVALEGWTAARRECDEFRCRRCRLKTPPSCERRG